MTPKPNLIQIIAVGAASVIAWLLAFALMWCAMWKIYVDTPLLLALSNILSGIGGALTTILVGRSLTQLNQQPNGNGVVATAETK